MSQAACCKALLAACFDGIVLLGQSGSAACPAAPPCTSSPCCHAHTTAQPASPCLPAGHPQEGNTGHPVFETAFGKIAVNICYGR